MNNYQTVLAVATAELIEKKSRFIGNCSPVHTQQDALDFLRVIKQTHPDARHNVFAYCLREGMCKRCSDDGEPQGTAGDPILSVLEKNGLTDCAVVVTRYFGGVLLGTGGLVRAYSHTAQLAVQAAQPIVMTLVTICTIHCDYSYYGKLCLLLNEVDAVCTQSEFGDGVQLEFFVQIEKLALLSDLIVNSNNGKFVPQILSEQYLKL